MNTADSLAKNTLYLNFSAVISKVIGLFSSILLARYLGATQFGQLTLFLTISNIFVVVTDFGVAQYIVREVAKDRTASGYWFSQIFSIKSLFMLPIGSLIIVIALLLPISPATKYVFALSIIFSIGKAYFFMVDGFFSAWERMKYSAFWSFLFAVFILVLTGLLILFKRLYINPVLMIHIVAVFLLLVVCFYQLKKVFNLTSFIAVPNLSIIKESYHFMLAACAGIIFSNADILLLRSFHGPAETGFYGIALAIYGGLLIVVSNTIKVVFPVFSRLYKESRNHFNYYANKVLYFIILFIIPLCVGGALLSRSMVTFMYGNKYLPSAITLSIILVAFSMEFLGSYLASIMQSVQLQKALAKISWFTVIVSFAAGIPLIYFLGHEGAAIARAVTSGFIFFSCFFALNKRICDFKFSVKILKSLAASAIMGFLLYFTRDLHFLISLPLGLMIYTGCILLFRTFSKEEYRSIFALLFRPSKIANT